LQKIKKEYIMGKKKKLVKINKISSEKILEIKAILEALSEIEQAHYPADAMIEIAKKKVIKVLLK